MATVLVFLAGGCLWEPIAETPDPGNSDVAPIIEAANPSNHEIGVNPVGAPCVLSASLLTVLSPRAAALSARFFLNYGDTTAARAPDGGLVPLALGGNGETDFPLQVSPDPTIYSLPTEEIALVDFLGQLNSPTNVLWVFVSDDFARCPDPSSVALTQQTSPSGTQTLECFTTSWSWVIDATGCDFLTAP